MTLTRLGERLSKLPLVLSGPMLRRCEPTGVTVFVALREERDVTLRVYDAGAAGATGRIRAEATRKTYPLGQHLHVVAVTAVPDTPLAWGGHFHYDLAFGQPAASAPTLLSAGILVPQGSTANPRDVVCYPTAGAPALPSFVLPPADLNQLKLLHGSCRKAGGPGKDLLGYVDELIKATITNPGQRPQQLYLTGDQIYADDVPDALLALLTDAGNTLLGWTPKVPLSNPPDAKVDLYWVGDTRTRPQLAPGGRQKLAEDECGFTSGAAKSHLLSIAEFYAQYLFAWSDVLWPSALPEFLDIYRAPGSHNAAWHTGIVDAMKLYEAECDQVIQFKSALKAVRRALANVPSYMMFDDHEVTDDWYIFLDWSERVLALPLGHHVLQNGIAAYAVFQGWGNTPERFAPDTDGHRLLTQLTQIGPDPSSGARMAMRAYIGPPPPERVTARKAVDHDGSEMDWHYTVRGANFETIVLDTRTWRSFKGAKTPSSMLSVAGFKRQLPLKNDDGYVAPPGADGITLVVAPGPVIDVDYYEQAKKLGSYVGARHKADVENWGHSLIAYERLFSRLFRRRSRIVLLSGDVHYGFTARMAYWANRPFEAGSPVTPIVRGVAAQACSSALRNGWGPGFSRRGYMRWDSLPEPEHFAGWHAQPYIWPTSVTKFRLPKTPPVAKLSNVAAASEAPDWRYRIDYILAARDQAANYVITAPSSWDGPASERAYADGLDRYTDFIHGHGAGKEIVGENNVGEIRFTWRADRQEMTHTLYWRLTEPQLPFPHSVFRIPLMLEPEPPAFPVL